MPIPSFVSIPLRAQTVIKEKIVNHDTYTISVTILGEPNGLTPGQEHKRLMIREHSNKRKEVFFVPDDGTTALIEWNNVLSVL